ncbi:MAG: O-antigen ligase family protein [Salibacteraceae bacterium]
MKKSAWYEKLYFAGLLLVVITLPFAKHYNSWMVGVVIAGWLAEGRFREKWQRLKSHSWWWGALAYYLLHTVALAYTENLALGGFILEKKTGLWLLPMLISSGPVVSPLQLKQLLRAFAGAVTLGLIYCLIRAGVEWDFAGNTQLFFHHNLSNFIGMHAIYLSAFVLLSLLGIGQWMLEANKTKIQTGLLITWAAFLIFCLLLLASKIMIINLLVLGSIAALVGFSRRGSARKGIAVTLGMLLLAITIILALPETRKRFQSVWDGQFEVVTMDHYVYSTPFNGLTLRLVIWRLGLEAMHEEKAWLGGLGPGDVQATMDSTYRESGLYVGNPDIGDHGYLGYNLHNQYLETLASIGIVGLLVLLIWWGALFFWAWKQRKWIAFLFLATIASFSLSESTLETHHGTLLVAFWGSLLLVTPKISDSLPSKN